MGFVDLTGLEGRRASILFVLVAGEVKRRRFGSLMTSQLLQRLAAHMILLLSFIGGSVSAQERTLHWRAVHMDAKLDSTGRLHVRERQTMVFSGPWNGGERRFDVRLGQDFRFERIRRVDSTSGAERELTEGDLSQVDQFGWAENRTLRWRSRREEDPVFDATEITYVIEYSYDNILVPHGQSYVLNHDFAFADRVGDIEAFTLALDVDRAWGRPATGFRERFGPTRLPPGEGYVVNFPLEFRRQGRPSAVLFAAAAPGRFALAAVLIAAVVLMTTALFRREAALGRFSPLPPAGVIDEAWLQTHVLRLLPEVVGAAWDDTTAAPEVAAVLARLVAEGKLASDVKTSGRGFFRSNALHLKLLVDREAFEGHERTLVDALFTRDSDETDTDTVRARYKSTGFDPASNIRKALETLSRSMDGERRVRKPARTPTLLLFGAAVLQIVTAGVTRSADAVLAVTGSGIAIVAWFLAMSQAYVWRTRVRALVPHALRFLIPLMALTGLLLVVLVEGRFRAGFLVLAGLTTLCLAVARSVLNTAKTRQTAGRIAQRQKLAAAREYFREQLRQPRPQLRDEWFPWLIAFGLGSQADRWFRSFGGEKTRSTRDAYPMGTSSHSTSSDASPSWSGMGGGGGFAGGGSSGSWAAAVGSIAAGVSAPSSSSSGGSSGGGGSSSGGGGGGGW
ncbi:MAG: DUF2207 domain-containing protein [Gemmatimonadaceae bacterium]